MPPCNSIYCCAGTLLSPVVPLTKENHMSNTMHSQLLLHNSSLMPACHWRQFKKAVRGIFMQFVLDRWQQTRSNKDKTHTFIRAFEMPCWVCSSSSRFSCNNTEQAVIQKEKREHRSETKFWVRGSYEATKVLKVEHRLKITELAP